MGDADVFLNEQCRCINYMGNADVLIICVQKGLIWRGLCLNEVKNNYKIRVNLRV